jgi:hypothetical protein
MTFKIKNRNGWKRIFLFLGLIAGPTALATQSVILSWSPSPSSGVSGYYIYIGTASGQYTQKIDAGANTQATINNLQDGQAYYFAATAYNSYSESSPSNVAQYNTPTLQTPPSLFQLVRSTSGSMTLQIPVTSGHWYEIQASADLRLWTTIATTPVMPVSILAQFSDPQATLFKSRYYRLVIH